ncbi:MAG: hypothetical protein ACM34K_10805 [Bacillota bacterium]
MNLRLIRNIVSVLLLSFAFHFAHSEFDFLTPELDNHSTHDYCQLVNSATVAHHINLGSVVKLSFSIDHNFLVPQFEIPVVNQNELLVDRHNIPLLHPGSPSFILNRTILI